VAVSPVFICGCGAVSPAGWGAGALREALARGQRLPATELARPGWPHPFRVRTVPAPSPRPRVLTHPRLRRTSPIAQHAVAAALEALGSDAARLGGAASRLGIVLCVMSGCVNYSRRFYDETLKDPATASPLVFPETVFNAPASHLAAVLGTTAINYTLVGDPGAFLQGLALAADWLLAGRVDGCLVIAAEEIDWLSAEAFALFDRTVILSEGAAALYLRREAAQQPGVRLAAITRPYLFFDAQSRARAAERAKAELGPGAPDHLLCDGLQAAPRTDRAEALAWQDWSGARLSPKVVLGEGLMAAAAWQCVAAFDSLRAGSYPAATNSVVGCNEQAIAVRFITHPSHPCALY